ncbi:hypothetical protein LZ30DRAFT_115478 [Colletotrichum cereale]|nr:hypothetical protein LZ30DRAFT_115478 [Colletotrichum cereale]
MVVVVVPMMSVVASRGMGEFWASNGMFLRGPTQTCRIVASGGQPSKPAAFPRGIALNHSVHKPRRGGVLLGFRCSSCYSAGQESRGGGARSPFFLFWTCLSLCVLPNTTMIRPLTLPTLCVMCAACRFSEIDWQSRLPRGRNNKGR